MLRLFFYIHDRLLKVRRALPQEEFSRPVKWKKLIEFEILESGEFTMIWTSMLPDLESTHANALIDLVSARYPFSDEYSTLEKLCSGLVFTNNNAEWVFFGGTFNPWHAGHQACLNLLPPDKTCFILPDRNPHKDFRHLNEVASILEISARGKFGKNHFLVPSFLLETKTNPTVNWIEKLKFLHPEKELSLLMGFDSFASLLNWTRSHDLIALLSRIYVVSRGESIEERDLVFEKIKAKKKELEMVFLGNHPYEKVTSTEIREKK